MKPTVLITCLLFFTPVVLTAQSKSGDRQKLQQKQADILFEQAIEAFNDRLDRLALMYFGDFQALYPEHPRLKESLQYQIRIHLRHQRYEKAAGLYESYFRMEPGHEGEQALQKAIQLYLRIGALEQAQRLQYVLAEYNIPTDVASGETPGGGMVPAAGDSPLQSDGDKIIFQ